MKNRTEYGRKGFVLVTALLVTSVSLLLVIPYASSLIADIKLTSIINNSTVALDLAEAGVERAIWEIAYNGKTSGFTIPVTSFQSSTGDNNCNGEYEVTVVTDGISFTITSNGYVPNKSSYKSKKTVMVEYSSHRAFGKGIIGISGITMSGQADIDSYDSSALDALGNLAGYNGLKADGTVNRGEEGDIASNGPITLTGQSKVYGSANPGPDYPFTGIPNVTGTYGTLQAPLVVDPIPDYAMTAALSNNNNSEIYYFVAGEQTPYPITNYNLSVSNQEIHLPGGTYYFDSISINGTMVIEGPSEIYISGDISIAGQGVMNTTSIPSSLLLFSTGSSINIAGMGAFYGAIYAPNATVVYTGQADFYGSIICGLNVDKGQAAIHYDKALANVTPSFVDNKVTSWQEIQ